MHRWKKTHLSHTYTYLCTHIYLSVHLCIYVSMYLCIYVSLYLCIYISMYLYQFLYKTKVHPRSQTKTHPQSHYIDSHTYIYLSTYYYSSIYLSINMNLYIKTKNAPPQPAEHFRSDLEIGVSEILSVPRQDFCDFEMRAGDFEIVGHFAESHR